jgi:hypothetical protein
MFKCRQCSNSAWQSRKIVTERKMVTHVNPPRGPRGGIGSQIVTEITVCDECASKIMEAPIERNVVERTVKKRNIEVPAAFETELAS